MIHTFFSPQCRRVRSLDGVFLKSPEIFSHPFIPSSAWHYNYLVLSNYLLDERIKPFIVTRHNVEGFQRV